MDTAAILQSLDAVRRRVKLLAVGYGIGLVLAAAVGAIVAVVVLDYLFNLPAWPRLVATAIGVIAIIILLARHVLIPVNAKIGLADVAGKLETLFPSLDDRLRSVVEYADRDIPGSPAMKQQVVTQTHALAGTIDFNQVVQALPATLSLAGGLGSILLIALLAILVAPNFARIAAARLVSPFDQNPWPKNQRIDLLSESPTRLPAGQRLDVKMKLGQGDRSGLRATLFSQIGSGPVQQQLMIRNADGSYAAVVDTQTPSDLSTAELKVWIRSGDDDKQLAPITLVQRLAIVGAEARVSPPAYVSGVPPSTVNLSAAPAVAAIGSAVQIAVTFNKAVEGFITLEPASSAKPQAPSRYDSIASDIENVRVVSLQATESMRFRVRAKDRDGFQNAAIEEYELIVRPDQSPTIQIEQPRRNEERTVESVVPLIAVAEDDYGITQVALHVERLADHTKWELPLIVAAAPGAQVVWDRDASSSERQRYRLGYAWELSKLADANLKSGDVLEFYLQATDNFSLGEKTHEPVSSGRLRITIISQDELTSRVTDEMRLTRAQIGEVAKSQTRVRAETTELADETKGKPSFDTADRTAAERMANQQSTAASQSRQLSQRLDAVKDRLEQNRSPRTDLADLSKQVAESLDRTAEGAMKDAAQQLSSASSPQQKQEPRIAAMDKAQQSQAEAAEQLQGAMDKLGDLGSLQQAIDNIRRLLEEQEKITKDLAELGKQNLGKKPEQMTPGDRQKLNELADTQNKLADRTAQAIAEMQKQAEQLQKSDPTAAEAMKQAAGTGQQRQVSPNQQKAAQEAKQNKQSSASAAQKQAEIGLQRMLQDLKEAESRKLAELQKQLADLQKQIANLVRRQAGHNVDNLMLQGEAKLKEVGVDPLSALLLKAQRKPDAPKSALPQLSQGQEQTERNARDIAKQADAVPDAAEAVAKLTRAAGRMERANVQLRQDDLPGAYDPPQVEALAALEEAKKLVDEQKKKVDEKVDEKKREAIRAVYIKVRDEQVKLNTETARIDAAPRKEDGGLKREELIKLGQLPTDQGKLSETIAGLEERIVALGGVVYKFANDDIANTMGEVKQNLADQKIDSSTQTEQVRIVSQLNSMIESLQDNPVESKFAQDGGGGGGQGQQGGPKLPAEAELRLLKGLQGAVNDSTQQLAKAAQKNDSAVKGMGDRQGQLRSVLNELLEKSSKGELSLGPEPDARDQLPDEAGAEAIDNQELDNDLLGGAADADAQQKKVSQVGDRMARSRQRLAVNLDPGKTTQAIQNRIMDDMDVLIEQARKQQAQTRNSEQQQQQGEAEAKQQPKAGEQQAQANNQGQQQQADAQNAADQSNAGGGLGQTQKGGAEIKESLREWGALSPRQRDAIIEGSGETVIEAYKKLVDDYYKSLATKATEK